MILPALLSFLPLQSAVQVPDPAELARAKEFLREAHTGLDGTVLPPFREGEAPWKIDQRDLARTGRRIYMFPSGMVFIDIKSARIVGYGFGGSPYPPLSLREADGSVTPRRVEDEDALALAKRFFNAAGYPGDIVAEETLDLQGSAENQVAVTFVRSYRGVPFYVDRGQGRVAVDRQTGVLEEFYPPLNVPEPPASVVPGGSRKDARLAALDAAGRWQGEPLVESPRYPMGLLLWTPRSSIALNPGEANKIEPGRARTLRPGPLAQLRANRALLVYAGSVVNAEGVRHFVVLDALTGLPLEMETLPLVSPWGMFSGGAPSASATAKPRPLPIPTVSRPWRVGREGAGGRRGPRPRLPP